MYGEQLIAFLFKKILEVIFPILKSSFHHSIFRCPKQIAFRFCRASFIFLCVNKFKHSNIILKLFDLIKKKITVAKTFGTYPF